MKIVQSPYPLGHEIQDVDVKDLSDEEFDLIRSAYDEFGVIVIRGQKMTPAQQVNFSRRFGQLDCFGLGRFNLREYPEIFVLSNTLAEGKPVGLSRGAEYWHSDMWNHEMPPRGSMLYALQVPHTPTGLPLGDTDFASLANAYDTLSRELRKEIENLHAVFSWRKGREYIGFDRPANGDVHQQAILDSQQGYMEGGDEIIHPIVRRHPINGRKCLFVIEGGMSHIVEIDRNRSDELLSLLLQHTIRPAVVYRHSWRVGDIVMWDNYMNLHRANRDYEAHQQRMMHRTTLSAPAAAIEVAGTAVAASA